jgi:hypothetical protein
VEPLGEETRQADARGAHHTQHHDPARRRLSPFATWSARDG